MSVGPERAGALMGSGRVMAPATSSRQGESNVAPMQQCWWFDEETLVVGDFFMKKTMENILENIMASAAVWEQDPREGCKSTRSAKYLTMGPEYALANCEMHKAKPDKNFKGVVVIRVERVYDIKSGPTAGQLP